MPASASSPITALVSSMDHPALFATAEHCERPCARSLTSAEDAFAAPASELVALADSSAVSPKAPIDCTMVFAASPSSMPPAVASVRVLVRAPPWMSADVRPPLASSSIASPHSEAE